MNPMSQVHSPNPEKTQYVGFLLRLKAFAFDYIVISGYILLLTLATFAVIRAAGLLGFVLRWPENPFLADLMAFIMLILPVILYFAFSEGSQKQATWGKRKAGLRVVNKQHGRLTLKQALVRSTIKFLPWQIAHTCLFQIPGWPSNVTGIPPMVSVGYVLLFTLVGIYIASVLVSQDRRTPYDLASGSFVIKSEM